LAENPKAHSRSKHIIVKYHFVYYKVKKGRIALVYYQTDNMLVDGLTKILGPTKHLRFVNLLYIKDLLAELQMAWLLGTFLEVYTILGVYLFYWS
jgi:hypothetical protein